MGLILIRLTREKEAVKLSLHDLWFVLIAVLFAGFFLPGRIRFRGWHVHTMAREGEYGTQGADQYDRPVLGCQ